MGTYVNYLNAKQRIEQTRSKDAQRQLERAFAASRKWYENYRRNFQDTPVVKRMKEAMERERLRLAALRREAVETPRTRDIYFRIRRSLFSWDEFASVRRGARAILESVIELARDEAFPWWLAVPSDEVRRLARLSYSGMSRSATELDNLAITRPARVVPLEDALAMETAMVQAGSVESAGAIMRIADNGHGWEANESASTRPDLSLEVPPELSLEVPLQIPRDAPPEVSPGVPPQDPPPVPQFVLRYRRGAPWNSDRAAWWLNYDLLCGTGRVLSCFVVGSETLPRPYVARMPLREVRRVCTTGAGPGVQRRALDSLEELSHIVSVCGPTAPPGLRAPLWNGHPTASGHASSQP